MGFFKDFENEIKIFFVLVALVILAGWFGALSSLSLSRVVHERPEPEQEATQEEGGLMVIQEEEQGQAEEGPVKYESEQVGVSFAYPRGWYVYDEATWQEDNTIALCETTATIENTIIISSKNLGRCVGVTEFSSWPGDMLLSFAETEWSDFPFVLQGEDPGLTEVGGVSAAAYPYLETSSENRKQAVRLYVNTAGRGYIIEFTQTDLEGNYDPVMDEILASVQWLQ